MPRSEIALHGRSRLKYLTATPDIFPDIPVKILLKLKALGILMVDAETLYRRFIGARLIGQ